MDNNSMLKLCRLCLVKDEVNIPIFEEQGDIRQIFLKISSCLPVKVSRDDQLPKKICDGCSYKLDMLYEFWNTSANAEKQLLTWLGEAGMSSQMADGTISAVAQQIKPADAFVKQETIDPPDIHMDDDDDDEEDKDYNMKQEEHSNNVEEPPPKRARRTAAVKAAIALDQNSDDDDDSGEPMTKVEDDSEDSDNDDHEPAFVDVPSTSADDQPGPSGVGKDGVEAPKAKPKRKSKQTKSNVKQAPLSKYGFSKQLRVKLKKTITPNKEMENDSVPSENEIKEEKENKYKCDICNVSFKSIEEVKNHPINNCKFKCETCSRTYNTISCFVVHILQHKINATRPKIDIQYTCTDCSLTFPDIVKLRGHTLLAHKPFSKPKTIKPNDGKVENDNDDGDLSCELCFDVFNSKKNLDEHMEFHRELSNNNHNSNLSINEMSDSSDDVVITQSQVDSLNTSVMLPKVECDDLDISA